MKVVACLGNPGPEYSTTRHNVGWWLADRLVEVWSLGRFRQEGPTARAAGRIGGVEVVVLKPLTYMNRSGDALAPLLDRPGFDPAADLLVVVDDVALEPGRARFRAGGSAGGTTGCAPSRAHSAPRTTAASASAWAPAPRASISPTGCSRPCRWRSAAP